ncbi:hypothetical protein ARMGADRAFT_1022774 [Armillaria gallica]|uniref:Uncharacterized protein n=1 Tax=Armillaria gallica TaxID=47427 RepID=A0A2H3EPA6_ARMGA|nr:hypothetical protein ARMGADRAFT_1022774 [Armillaria gallica]
MDQVAQIQGREINDIFLPTTTKETYQYGPTERHKNCTLPLCTPGSKAQSSWPGHGDMPEDMKDAVRLYHGEVKGTIPLELLDLAKADAVLSRRWSLGIAKRDFPCLTPALEKFKGAMVKKGVSYDEFIAKGHNHVSVVLALETG